MKAKAKEIAKEIQPKSIKVQLDEKTIIYLLNMASFEAWLKKYPGAKVITY